LFTTSSANIGGWNVNSSSLTKTSNQGTITLNSATAQMVASSASYTAGIAAPDLNNEADIVIWAGGPRSTASNFYVQANGTVVMKSAIITGYASANDVLGLAKADMSNVTTIDGGKITTGIIKSGNHSGATDGSDFSGGGTAINLTGGGISAKNFRLTSGGDAFFNGSVFSNVSLSSSSITGTTIGGSKIVVSSAISSSALVAYSDFGLSESTDSTSGGNPAGSSPSTTQTAVTIESGKIVARTSETINGQTLSGQSGVLRLEGENYVELLAGGTQSAMFDTTRSSLTFTTGLYLGNPNTSSSSSIQDHSAPWVTVDAKMRLRRGAPLFYPGGTAGAYVRNIYIKNTTSNPSSTTGNVGDIMITY